MVKKVISIPALAFWFAWNGLVGQARPGSASRKAFPGGSPKGNRKVFPGGPPRRSQGLPRKSSKASPRPPGRPSQECRPSEKPRKTNGKSMFLQLAAYRAFRCQVYAQDGQVGAQDGQVGARLTPKTAKLAPKTAKLAPKMAKLAPKTARLVPKIANLAPKTRFQVQLDAQDGQVGAQDGQVGA